MWAIVPVKNLNAGKGRLAPNLPPDARRALVCAMLRDVLSALTRCTAITRTILVTRCPEAARLAHRMTLPVLNLSEDRCLNSGVSAAVDVLSMCGVQEAMVLHGDLPLVRSEDISTVVCAHYAGKNDVTLVPDNDNIGTNAMLLKLPTAMQFAYGNNSFLKHKQYAQALNLRVQTLHNARIGNDIDLWHDLKPIYSRPAPTHFSQWLAQHGALCGWPVLAKTV